MCEGSPWLSASLCCRRKLLNFISEAVVELLKGECARVLDVRVLESVLAGKFFFLPLRWRNRGSKESIASV